MTKLELLPYHLERDAMRRERAEADALRRDVGLLECDGLALRDALAVVLPMAKGYAAEHQVGNNAVFIEDAERTLRVTSRRALKRASATAGHDEGRRSGVEGHASADVQAPGESSAGESADRPVDAEQPVSNPASAPLAAPADETA